MQHPTDVHTPNRRTHTQQTYTLVSEIRKTGFKAKHRKLSYVSRLDYLTHCFERRYCAVSYTQRSPAPKRVRRYNSSQKNFSKQKLLCLELSTIVVSANQNNCVYQNFSKQKLLCLVLSTIEVVSANQCCGGGNRKGFKTLRSGSERSRVERVNQHLVLISN